MKEKEELERICINCNHFFPATAEPTEFGICLNDEEFEPFIEELLENLNYTCCQDLINRKKFSGEQPACANFQEPEYIDIDDESPLVRRLLRLCETGKFSPESLEMVLLKEVVKNIDWKTMPVDQYGKQLRATRAEEQQAAISTLGVLISYGNKEAFKVLFNFFKELPPPRTIEEVHLKRALLRELSHSDTRTFLLPQLIDELYHTPSNNTTRQWIEDIFRFLKYFPPEEIREPLEKMLKDRRFSYRFKQKIKNILSQ